MQCLAGLMAALLPALWTLFAPIPIQALPQAVRWASFGMMIAGLSGLARADGARGLFNGICIAGGLAAISVIFLGPDGTAGNPNRLGPLLAVSAVACASRRTGISAWARLPLGALSAAGLFLSGFYTGWIGLLLGLGWLLTGDRWGIRPILPVTVLVVGQLVLGLSPGLAGRIHPSAQLRTLIWRQGVDLSLERFPTGAGTGQARLHLYSTGPERLRQLAGEDRRIDHLHSDLLTLPVEQGAVGLVALLLLILWISRARGGDGRGAMLLAVWPMLATDLPLATPLGALPVAAVIACVPPRRGSVRLPGWLPSALAVAALAWTASVLTGYVQLHRGRAAAMRGRHGEAAEHLDRATDLIPFEERAFLYLAASRLEQGATLAAADAAASFNRIYPSYWRGHELEGTVLLSLGRPQAAGGAFLQALKLSPRDSTRTRFALALGALYSVPENLQDRQFLAKEILRNFDMPHSIGPEGLRSAASALRELADSLESSSEIAPLLRGHALRFESAADRSI